MYSRSVFTASGFDFCANALIAPRHKRGTYWCVRDTLAVGAGAGAGERSAGVIRGDTFIRPVIFSVQYVLLYSFRGVLVVVIS